jgi:hypothetical protein
MITAEDLARWAGIEDLNKITQEAINASELMRDQGWRLDPDVSFKALVKTVLGLAQKMPSSLRRGFEVEVSCALYTSALMTYDRETMASQIEDFERLFEISVKALREQHSFRRWNETSSKRLAESLSKNIDLMQVDSFTEFLKHSTRLSVDLQDHRVCDGEKVLLFGAAESFKNHRQLFTCSGISCLANQLIKEDSSKSTLGMGGDVCGALGTAKLLIAVHEAGIFMTAWQLDRLLITQVLERLTQAHKALSDQAEREILANGVKAIAGIFSRPIGVKPTMRDNCFRPYLYPTDWKSWMDPEPMKALTEHLATTLSYIDSDGSSIITEAVAQMKMQILVDGTLCAQSLAPKNGAQTNSRHACAVAMANMIRALTPDCEEPLGRPGAMKGLDHKARAVLISLLPKGSVRLDLLRANKRSRGRVLEDDLGM